MDEDFELVSLNADQLDIEELERRLELAVASGDMPDGWICGVDVRCPQLTCGVNNKDPRPPCETLGIGVCATLLA